MGIEQQSPINLQAQFSLEVDNTFLIINWPTSMKGVMISDQQHGLKVAFQIDKDDPAYVTLRGKRYLLRQFHFHHLSEHWLEGDSSIMELHVVHQSPDDASYCVIAVFLELGVDVNTSSIVAMCECAKQTHQTQNPQHVSMNPNDWLPSDTTRFFYYHGSLTTPPYTESVSWVVYKNALQCTQQNLEKIIGGHAQDARDIQPLNRRIVLELHAPVAAQ